MTRRPPILRGAARVRSRAWQWRLKRPVSIITAAVALVLLSPLLLTVAAAIKLSDPCSPVLFRQTRVGQGGTTFTLIKFRTMRMAPPERSDQDWHDVHCRVTWLGAILRRHFLDELPQLWNVLRGDMAIVGPRPERPHFAERFASEIPAYRARHRTHVGLTGWAAIHGLRGDTDIAARAAYDNHYIENWSLWLDVKIVLATIGTLVRGQPGAPAEPESSRVRGCRDDR